jgi:hypothetical protein
MRGFDKRIGDPVMVKGFEFAEKDKPTLSEDVAASIDAPGGSIVYARKSVTIAR